MTPATCVILSVEEAEASDAGDREVEAVAELWRLEQALADDRPTRRRECTRRGVPYGATEWAQQTAARVGLTPHVRGRGRPRQANHDRRK